MELLRGFAAIGLVGAMTLAGFWGWAAAADPTGSTPAGAIILQHCNIKALQTAPLATDRPGVIALVDPKEGDTVKKGQEIVRLMDEVPQANWEVAKLVADDAIEVEFATKSNAVDALEYEKSVAANQKAPGTISEIELERLKLNEVKSGLQIKKAKHDIAVNEAKAKQAKAELDTYRILAPFDGFVSQVLKHRGEAVKQGDTILDMVNTDVVHVEGMVKEWDIWRVKRGAPVEVTLEIKKADKKAYLDVEKQVFRGKIGFVDQVASVGDTRVWAEVPNPGNILRPGFRATMKILPGPADERSARSATRPAAQVSSPSQFSSKIAGSGDSRTP
jgi:RND family efflux transporter MFP subunit